MGSLIGWTLGGCLFVAVLGCWRGDLRALVALGSLCVLWLIVDKSFEGPVLVAFTSGEDGHGLVLADLVAVLSAAAGVLGWRRARRLVDGSG